jgi:hypothetical protein
MKTKCEMTGNLLNENSDYGKTPYVNPQSFVIDVDLESAILNASGNLSDQNITNWDEN